MMRAVEMGAVRCTVMNFTESVINTIGTFRGSRRWRSRTRTVYISAVAFRYRFWFYSGSFDNGSVSPYCVGGTSVETAQRCERRFTIETFLRTERSSALLLLEEIWKKILELLRVSGSTEGHSMTTIHPFS